VNKVFSKNTFGVKKEFEKHDIRGKVAGNRNRISNL